MNRFVARNRGPAHLSAPGAIERSIKSRIRECVAPEVNGIGTGCALLRLLIFRGAALWVHGVERFKQN